MFISFFYLLRQHGIKTSIKEYLHLLEALKEGVIKPDLEEFYYLAKTVLVKHEGQLDGFECALWAIFRRERRL